MSATRPPSSLLLWAVTALALLAIGWRLLASAPKGAHSVVPVAEAGAHAAARDERLEDPAPPPREVSQVEAVASTPADRPPIGNEDAPAPPQALLYGFVKPPQGREAPWGGTTVAVTDRLGVVQRTQAASDGAYAFPGLAPGRYWVRAGGTTSGEARASLDLESDRRLDLELKLPPEVRVKVVDHSGAPVREFDLLAVATADPPGAWIDEVRGSFNNPFGVGHWWGTGSPGEDLPADWFGRVVLDVEPPVFVSLVRYQFVVATQRVERGQDEVTFVLDPDARALQPGSLRLRPVDAQSRVPLTGAMVRLDGGAGTRTGKQESEIVSFSSLSPGLYTAHVHVNGHGDPGVRVRVEPGVETDLGDVPLGPATWIAGRVVGEDGAPVARADVRYSECDADGAPLAWVGIVYVARSDTDGSFKVGGLARGLTRISVDTEPWARWARTVDTRAGPVEGLEVRLVRAVPLVVGASNDSWSTVRFRVLDTSGNEVLSSRLYQPEPMPIRLAPGRYEVEVRATPGAEPRRIPVTLSDAPVPLSLP